MALATYCNFACLYGRSPVGLDDGDRQIDGIHAELRRFLQQIAWDVVTAQCERLIRSYDPCISCATHFLRLERIDDAGAVLRAD